MPSSAPQIPEAAVVAAAKRRHPLLSQYNAHAMADALQEATSDLQAAYPHLLAAWTEQVEKMAEARELESQDCGPVISITDLEYILERLADPSTGGSA